MRIVGGRLSGRRFSGPPGDRTRPTAERTREGIASALEARGWIDGAVVLDLWAGTGALAFEALSRGAARATLVEGDRRVARAIERSARELGLSERAAVIVADLDRPPDRWIASLAEPADLVFCDPPYAQVARISPVLSALVEAGKLRPGAAVVVEHAKKAPPALPLGFGAVAAYRYGDTAVLLGSAPREERRNPE